MQVKWETDEISKSIKEKVGVFLNTQRNRNLGIVGLPYTPDIIKGRIAQIGEIRNWKGGTYRKVANAGNFSSDWKPVNYGQSRSSIKKELLL